MLKMLSLDGEHKSLAQASWVLKIHPQEPKLISLDFLDMAVLTLNLPSKGLKPKSFYFFY